MNEAVLYMALELSHTKWRLAFGDGTRQRQVVIAAGDIVTLDEQLDQGQGEVGVVAGGCGSELLRIRTR